MRIRRICCLYNLGMAPFNSRKQLQNENDALLPWQPNSHKRKGEHESQFLGRIDKKEVQGPQGRERDIFFPLHCIVLVNIAIYLAQGHVSP